MTSGERRRIIVAVLSSPYYRRRIIVAGRTSEQFRHQRLSEPGQRRQRRYQRWRTVPDFRGSDREGPITDCFVIGPWKVK